MPYNWMLDCAVFCTMPRFSDKVHPQNNKSFRGSMTSWGTRCFRHIFQEQHQSMKEYTCPPTLNNEPSSHICYCHNFMLVTFSLPHHRALSQSMQDAIILLGDPHSLFSDLHLCSRGTLCFLSMWEDTIIMSSILLGWGGLWNHYLIIPASFLLSWLTFLQDFLFLIIFLFYPQSPHPATLPPHDLLSLESFQSYLKSGNLVLLWEHFCLNLEALPPGRVKKCAGHMPKKIRRSGSPSWTVWLAMDL